MGVLQIALILAAFLCSLVAGFLFAFATVVMPGMRSLSDRDFIRAFQVIDGVIQNSQPLFLLVWIGSILLLVTSAGLGLVQLGGGGRLLIILAVIVYLFGVQLPTITINIPMNNRLQRLDVGAMGETEIGAARKDFEPRWNRWNSIRAALASGASALLLILLFSL